MQCGRCGQYPAVIGLLCGICRKADQARPRLTTYERPDKVPETDYWQLAHARLYPDVPYNRLVKPQRYRITELARRMAQLPHKNAPPPVDDEIHHHLAEWFAPQVDDDGQFILF